MVLKLLKLNKFFNGVKRSFSYIQVGCRKGGRNSKISAKKAVFLVRVARQTFHHFGPPRKLLEKSTCGPWKSFRRPCTHKHAKLHHFCKKLCCITLFGNIVQQHQCGKQAVARCGAGLFGLAVSIWPIRSDRFGHGTFRSDYEILQKSYIYANSSRLIQSVLPPSFIIV